MAPPSKKEATCLKEKKPRYRHMCRVKAIYNFLNNIDEKHPERAEAKREMLRSTGFGSIIDICKWTKIPGDFVKWVSTNFEPEERQIRLSKFEVLSIKVEDVQRVYDLPVEGKRVKPSECLEVDITDLRKEIGLEVRVSDVDRVNVKDMDEIIPKLKKTESWCKAMIVYIIGCLLCPDNIDSMTLRYASIVKDLRRVPKYNWCQYVWSHLQKGTHGLKAPKADLHFFMIHYIERMGRESHMSRDICAQPSLKAWDVKKELKVLDAIGEHCGFGRGITSGYINRPERDAEPQELITFDPALCPINKAPEYASFLETQIETFKTCLNVLEDRMASNINEESEDEASDDECSDNERTENNEHNEDDNGNDEECDGDDELIINKVKCKTKDDELIINKVKGKTKAQIHMQWKKLCEDYEKNKRSENNRHEDRKAVNTLNPTEIEKVDNNPDGGQRERTLIEGQQEGKNGDFVDEYEAAWDTLEIELSTAGKSNLCPLMMNQPVAGKQESVVKAFECDESGDKLWPINENIPFFDIVLAKTNVKPLCRMEFPQAICPLLPSSKVPAILTCNSKTWETTLIGNIGRKKFDNDTWRKFVTDNNLKFDDCLVFQIMESRADEIKFAVQILRNDFPSELEDLVAGNTVNID